MREKSDPAVIEYLKRENEYTERMMRHTRELREKLYRELRGRMRESDTSVPYRRGDYNYYRRFEEESQYDIHCRARILHDGSTGPEEVLLDLNVLAHGKPYCDLGAMEISPDQCWMAYTIDTDGYERYSLHLRNLETGTDADLHVENVHGRFQWANDSRTLFYVTLDETLRPYRLHRLRFDELPEADELVYEETDPAYRMLVTKTRSREYIFIRLTSQVTTEVWFLDADQPEAEFQLVEPRREGIEYYLLHRGDRFYILTNDNALDFCMMSCPISAPDRSHWSMVVPERDGVMVEDAEIFANHLVLFERQRGLNAIRILNLASGEDHYISFSEPLFNCWSGRNPQYDTNLFRCVYTSLVVPETVISYNMDTREHQVMKVEVVVGGYEPSAYTSERRYATAEDGEKVPISLVYRKGLNRDGSNPLVLYGYGAYGVCVEPEFWSGRLSLLDRGFVYAIAHVRGGSELGRGWYQNGKLLSKMNTFTDFIACAEHLVAEGYTSSERLVIEGTSAGGLLIGSVVNMRPDLFRAAIADVPFVDVINTMMDDSIPRTVTEYDEWGNPIEDRQVREYLASYSPYDNVAPREYPNLLITAGLNDPRVHYWEPAKWAAMLRALKTDDNLLLLRTNFRSGHFGPSGRFDYLREFAFELAFIFDVLGIEV